MAASQQSAPLLHLPAELRNTICEHALTVNYEAELSARQPLLETCKQIRSKARKIYWSSNSFRFTVTAHQLALRTPCIAALANLHLLPRLTIIPHVTAKLRENMAQNLRSLPGEIDAYFNAHRRCDWKPVVQSLLQAGVPPSSIVAGTPESTLDLGVHGDHMEGLSRRRDYDYLITLYGRQFRSDVGAVLVSHLRRRLIRVLEEVEAEPLTR